jgi:xanthine permease
MTQTLKTGPASTHRVDERLPIGNSLVLGLQHVLVMYTGCVAVPLVFGAAAGLSHATIGLLINADLLVAGIVTLVQSLGIHKFLGVRLPVVAGASFTAVNPMILIAGEYGLSAVYGSMIAAGIFGLLIAVPFSKIVRFFPPVVRGTAVTIIGLSLIGKAISLIAGSDPTAAGYGAPRNLALALGIVVAIVLLVRFARSFLGQTAVLAGLVLGTGAAFLMGMTDFSGVGDADWFGLPNPFHFGAPAFPVAAVISMCIVMLIVFTESTAYILAMEETVGKQVTDKDLARGLAADGLSGILAGMTTSFLDTVFAQNVSLVRMTKVHSRYVTAVAGIILMLMGLLPKLGEIVAKLPGPVIGAVSLVMFGMVAGVGIRTLGQVGYDDNHNMTIVGLALAVGMIPVVAPGMYDQFPAEVRIIAGGSITSAVIVAFTLNLLFNHLPFRDGTTESRAAEDTEIEKGVAGA